MLLTFLSLGLISLVACAAMSYGIYKDRWHTITIDHTITTVGMRSSCDDRGCSKENFGFFGVLDECPDRSGETRAYLTASYFVTSSAVLVGAVGAILTILMSVRSSPRNPQPKLASTCAAAILMWMIAQVFGGLVYFFAVKEVSTCGIVLCDYLNRLRLGIITVCDERYGLSMYYWAVSSVLATATALTQAVLTLRLHLAYIQLIQVTLDALQPTPPTVASTSVEPLHHDAPLSPCQARLSDNDQYAAKNSLTHLPYGTKSQRDAPDANHKGETDVIKEDKEEEEDDEEAEIEGDEEEQEGQEEQDEEEGFGEEANHENENQQFEDEFEEANPDSENQNERATEEQDGEPETVPEGYEFDEESGLYWSSTTGFYWDSESAAFFNPYTNEWVETDNVEESVV